MDSKFNKTPVNRILKKKEKKIYDAIDIFMK